MKWFRLKKREEEAPGGAAAPAAFEKEEPAQPEAEAERKPARRRRGSRGGRGRTKKKAEAATAESEAPAAPARAKQAPRKKAAPSGREKGRGREETKKAERRRSPARKTAVAARAPAPDVKKEILVSVDVLEQTVAVLEDGKVAEVYLGRPSHRSIAGNIYKGVVDNVLPGMEASFVDIGLDRNGFLYVDEIVVPELEGKRHGKRIQELISRGQEVLVQAVKDPMGTKGARLTTEISLPGRFLVYTPYGDGIGVSRRLEDDERERLKAICKSLELPEGGLIVRTAAEGASEEELVGDLKLLLKLWSTIRSRAATTKAPSLVYQEAELPLRIVRDLFIRDFVRVVVDHERTYRKIVAYLKRTSPELAARVERYKGKEPLIEKSGVLEAVNSTLSRRVDLPSGGYLVFDYAEAFTVIDVNTGRFVGGRGKSSNARLEDTITKNNLEAVTEVVRQLRLRDIGGIIVIDFIDMANPKNRQLVEGAFEAELARDRTKTYVVEISPLGLVEMTRQNVTDGPREILTDKCPTCESTGVVVSAETRAVEVERKLRGHVAGSRAAAFLVELHSDVAEILVGPGGERLQELEKETGKRFAFKTKKSFRLDRFAILAEGKVESIDGLEPKAAGAKAPEKSRGRSRKAEPAVVALDETLIEDAEDAVAAEEAGSGEPAGPAADGDQPAERPKKKTRRGSRGGRGRKKKPAAAADGAAKEAPAAEAPPAPEAVTEPPSQAEEPGAERRCPGRGEAEEEDPARLPRGPAAEEEAGRAGRGRVDCDGGGRRLDFPAEAGPARSFPVYELRRHLHREQAVPRAGRAAPARGPCPSRRGQDVPAAARHARRGRRGEARRRPQGRAGDRQGRRARPRQEGHRRQAQAPHRLQAPKRLPCQPHAHRGGVDRGGAVALDGGEEGDGGGGLEAGRREEAGHAEAGDGEEARRGRREEGAGPAERPQEKDGGVGTDGSQEGTGLVEERPRLRVEATRRQGLRRPGDQGGHDRRPPARHALPPRRRHRPRARPHDLRHARREGFLPDGRRGSGRVRPLGGLDASQPVPPGRAARPEDGVLGRAHSLRL